MSKTKTRCILAVLLFLAALMAVLRVPTAAALLIGFAVITPLERWRPRRADQPVVRPALTADVTHVLVTFPLAFVLGLLPALLTERLLPDPPTLVGAIHHAPLWTQALIGLLALEFVDYWIHRALHEVPLLWRLHQVHHTIEHMDWVAGARVHPLSALVSTTLRSVPFVLIGIDLRVIGPLAAVAIVSAVLTHANLDVRWRPIHKIWVTPDFHHWHHAAEPAAYNTNYGGLLPIWDLVFGTYHLPDRQPFAYGIEQGDPGTWLGHMKLPFQPEPDQVDTPRTFAQTVSRR